MTGAMKSKRPLLARSQEHPKRRTMAHSARHEVTPEGGIGIGEGTIGGEFHAAG
jgi:hypothetical protein